MLVRGTVKCWNGCCGTEEEHRKRVGEKAVIPVPWAVAEPKQVRKQLGVEWLQGLAGWVCTGRNSVYSSVISLWIIDWIVHVNELQWKVGSDLSNPQRLGFDCHRCGVTCAHKAMTLLFNAGILSWGRFYPQFHPSLPCHFHYSGDLVCLPDSAVSCTPH